MSVYLDHNATTPLDPRVRETMEPWLLDRFGNASSRDHKWGWDAAGAVEDARRLVAESALVSSHQVFFVSGATEALNTILASYVGFGGWHHKKVVLCATEHDAVLTPARYLCKQTAVAIDLLPVNHLGHLGLADLRAAVDGHPGTLVALMAANSEIGTIHPIRDIAEVVHAAGAMLMCDTAQAIGKCPVDVDGSGIDFATISAHKIYGPKGAGALLVGARRKIDELQPLIFGGGQERGVRGGTLNVPGIVGLGEACRLAADGLRDARQRIGPMRDRLETGILSQLTDAWVNGDRSNRIYNTSNIGFKGIDARTMIRDMHDIAVSTRSACSSGDSGPSHVLKAIGLSDEDAYSCIRFSLGRFTTEEEIDYTINKVVTSVHKLRRNKSVRM